MVYLSTVLALYGALACRGEAFAEKPSVKPAHVLTVNASPLPAGQRSMVPAWAVPSLRYRILIEVSPVNIGKRALDQAPACLALDIHSRALEPLKLRQLIDLDSIQVIRYNPTTGKTIPGPPWPFARTPGECASRFLDKSLPWDFPTAGAQTVQGSKLPTFPRGAFLCNVRGSGNPGLLVWDHVQNGQKPSYYAVYFNTLPSGKRQKPARQGFLGDGSPRRDISDSSLTGTLYNRVAVDDWDGDGLPDLLIGGGFGYILLYRNEGDRYYPRFRQGEYLWDSTGNILNAGGMSSPCVVDWNGDGKKDLLVGIEGSACLAWYENIGTNKNRKLAYQGFIQADGKAIVVPHKPCPEAPHYTRDYAPSVEAVDWNGDGKLDLLLGGYITGYIWYYENIGTNPDGTPRLTFRGPLEADGKPLDTIWGAHPCAVDLNGDGKLDLLSGSFGQAMGGGDAFHKFLIYYENTGTHTHPKLTEKPVQYEGEEPHEILAQARVLGQNRRGLTDLIISTFTKVYFAENVGTKSMPKWKLHLLEAPWGLAPLSATQLMDWNGDGFLDLINSPLDSNSCPTVRLNRGKGTHGVFGPPQLLLPPGQAISHRAPYGDQWAFTYLHDFDKDGDLDILWADGPGNVYLHRNNGSPKSPDYDTVGEKLMLTNGQPIKVGPPVVPIEEIKDFDMMQGSRACVTAFDYNEDGKTDVVVGDTYGDIFYFENAGNHEKPVFLPGLKLGNLVSRALPLTYDWDHDGRMDVVGVSWAGRMEWYRNRGPGAKPLFAPPQKFTLPPTVMYSPRIVMGDWNGDGDDDILVMSSYPWFCWLEASYIQNGYAQGRVLSVEQKGSAANNVLPQSRRLYKNLPPSPSFVKRGSRMQRVWPNSPLPLRRGEKLGVRGFYSASKRVIRQTPVIGAKNGRGTVQHFEAALCRQFFASTSRSVRNVINQKTGRWRASLRRATARRLGRSLALQPIFMLGRGHRCTEGCLENQRSSTAKSVVFAREEHTWTQKGFREFRAGTFEDGGANLFVLPLI